MKNLKVFATLFFSMLVLFASPCSLRTFAAETDALEITITADKENYSTGDTVKLNVNVKNNNSYTIDSLSLEGSISDNFTISENKNYSMKLEPSESKDYTITAKQNNQDSPQTGVTPPIIPAVLLGASLIFVTFTLIKNKKARKMLAVVLCVTSISGFCFDKSSFKAIAAEYITVTKESTFKYNNKDITAKITAKYEDMDVIIVNTKPLGEKLDDGSYNVTEVISTLDGTLRRSNEIKEFSYKITDMKNAVVGEGKLPVAEKWVIGNFGLVVGGNNVEFTAVDNNNKVYITKLIVFNANAENMNNTNVDLTDNDNDKLPAYYENWFGTDSDNSDSDNDGLNDYDEIYLYNTDPTKSDTDSNGINDMDDDADKDGLSLKEELALGTEYFVPDSDGDTIIDGEEVKNGTDPLKADSDEDGLNDNEESELGYDPLKADTDGDGIIDSKELKEQSISLDLGDNTPITDVSVTLTVPGNIKKHVQVNNTENVDKLSTGVVGRIGAPVEFTSDVEFESAEIVFKYDDAILGDTPIENLAIMWYDEENEQYVIFDKDTVIDTEAKTLTYTTTHFSTYLVVDRQIWYDTWREPINYRDGEVQVETKYDLSFVVDVSGSMSGSSIQRAKLAMNSFIDAMCPQDSASLVTFNSYGKLIKAATSDKETLRSSVSLLSAGGGTNTDSGLKLGIDQIETNGRTGATPVIIMICDGDVNYVQSTIDRAISNGAAVYTINVINGNNSLLQKIADQTGGEYYYAATTEEIVAKMNNIRQDTLGNVDMTDTDGDGLYDVYETKGMRIQNGVVVKTNPLHPDTDKDGISDADEFIGPREPNIPYGPYYLDMDFAIGKYSCVVFRAKSNPNTCDTDGDTVLDKDDLNPYVAARHSIVTNDESPYKKMDSRVTNFDFMESFEQRLRAENDATYATLSDQVDYTSYAAKSYAYLVVAGGAATIILEENAAWALSWFLANSGMDKEFTDLSMLSYTNTKEGYGRLQDQLNEIHEFAQDVLYDGQSITIGSVSSFRSYEDNLLGVNAINWTATLGTASGGASATITRNGNEYKINLDYTIFDYYDWNLSDDRTFIPLLPNASLALMHYEGIARAYYQYGTYSGLYFK